MQYFLLLYVLGEEKHPNVDGWMDGLICKVACNAMG